MSYNGPVNLIRPSNEALIGNRKVYPDFPILCWWERWTLQCVDLSKVKKEGVFFYFPAQRKSKYVMCTLMYSCQRTFNTLRSIYTSFSNRLLVRKWKLTCTTFFHSWIPLLLLFSWSSFHSLIDVFFSNASVLRRLLASHSHFPCCWAHRPVQKSWSWHASFAIKESPQSVVEPNVCSAIHLGLNTAHGQRRTFPDRFTSWVTA